MDFMDFFIDSAWAQAGGTGAPTSNPLVGFLPLIVIFVLFYFLLIRPQSKKQKEHRQMLDALGKEDEVVTGGGLLGKIVDVGEQFVTVEFGDGDRSVRMKVQKSTIAAVVPKGTIKTS
ncbi:MAG TPA: preprotein translocase subunit YajC [Gammaproteobacteria bacterium]|nr:preprotein translocase subunit YajC [Gammaproteobacteria bacterium]